VAIEIEYALAAEHNKNIQIENSGMNPRVYAHLLKNTKFSQVCLSCSYAVVKYLDLD
jgi:hypothetical protein